MKINQLDDIMINVGYQENDKLKIDLFGGERIYVGYQEVGVCESVEIILWVLGKVVDCFFKGIF